jgi:hypothetical protein
VLKVVGRRSKANRALAISPEATGATGRTWERAATVAIATALAVSTVLIVVSATTGVPGGDRAIGAFFDASLKATLPTWWSTALFTVAAVAHGSVAMVASWVGARGGAAWASSSGVLATVSLAEHSAALERADEALRLLAGMAALAVFLIVAVRVGGRASAFVATGGLVTVVALIGGDLAGGHILLLHAAELAANVGALLLLAAAVAAVRVSSSDRAVGVALRASPDASGGTTCSPRPVAWIWPVAVSVALSAASLVAVLALGPSLRELRLFLDVLVEDNLPTWWSAALLLVAAMAHAVVAVVGRATGVRVAGYWFITAAVLTLLALDDHTQLHERTEVIGRILVEAESYPFLWLVPGAVAGAAVAATMVFIAVRSPRRTRRLLLAGVVLLLFCALGLEFIQGLFMAAGEEGAAFALSYHIEELGENFAALLMMAAAVSTLEVTVTDQGLVVRSVW